MNNGEHLSGQEHQYNINQKWSSNHWIVHLYTSTQCPSVCITCFEHDGRPSFLAPILIEFKSLFCQQGTSWHNDLVVSLPALEPSGFHQKQLQLWENIIFSRTYWKSISSEWNSPSGIQYKVCPDCSIQSICKLLFNQQRKKTSAISTHH